MPEQKMTEPTLQKVKLNQIQGGNNNKHNFSVPFHSPVVQKKSTLDLAVYLR